MQYAYTFGPRITDTAKYMIIGYAAIYVLELILSAWLNTGIVPRLMIWPPESGNFGIWQILTHPFIHDPGSPIVFLINCLVLYFFVSPTEFAFGTRGFLTLFYLSAAGSAVTGLLFTYVSGFNAPFCGMIPSLLSLIVVFGLINPESTILLFFIIPIKAKYISYGTIIITAITFLAKVNPHGAYHLGGILFGYIYLRGPASFFSLKDYTRKFNAWKYNRRKSRFTVVQDNRNNKKDSPTYH